MSARGTCRDGNGSDKTGNVGHLGKRAAVGSGPYGGVRGVSIIDGRVAGDGDPYGGVRGGSIDERRAARSGGPYGVCCRSGSENSRIAPVSGPPPRRRGAGGKRAWDDRLVSTNGTAPDTLAPPRSGTAAKRQGWFRGGGGGRESKNAAQAANLFPPPRPFRRCATSPQGGVGRKKTPSPKETVLMERPTRLELATSTLARWRSTR